jgi:bifunctional DNase/RNase
MNTSVRLGVMALLVLAVLGVPRLADLAPDRPDVAPPKPTGAQEVEVIAVMVDQDTQQPTVLLQGKRDKRSVALAIGLAEATGIAVPLQGVTPPRPLTHDLFLTLFGRLKVTLTRVVITDLRDDIFYAIIYLNAGGPEFQLDARPSDAIALAIRAKVPVLVEERVFEKAGNTAPPRRPSI